MNSADRLNRTKANILQKLKLFGVFSSKNDIGTGNAKTLILEEFTWNKPNYEALPVILYRCFENIDKQKCAETFSDCWPLSTSKDRKQFRPLAIAWVDEIRKKCRSLKLDSLSVFFDSPYGDRYIEFLDKFTKFAMCMGILQLMRETADENSLDSGGSAIASTRESSTNAEMEPRWSELMQFIQTADSEGNTVSELEKKLLELVQVEHVGMKNDAYRQLFKDEETDQQIRELAVDDFIETAKKYFSPAEISTGMIPANLDDFHEKVVQCFQTDKVELEREEQLVDELRALMNEREPALVPLKYVLKGVNSPEQMEEYKGLYRSDGRLDFLKLVQLLRSTMHDLMEEIGNDFEKLLDSIGEPSMKSAGITKRVIEEQLQKRESLLAKKEEMQSSINTMKEKIEAYHREKPLPLATPGFAEVFNMKPFPDRGDKK